jgi:modulator of FtsH protease HflK
MPLNDPQWGRRNNEGPPDLDELWRRFSQRLNELFGRKSSGKAPERGTKSFGGPGLLLLVIIAVWLASGYYQIEAGRVGVILRFGKHVATTDEGPHWHLPYPIESQAEGSPVNIAQVRTLEVGYRNNVKSRVPQESLMLTDDENIIDIEFAVQYTVKSPEDFLFNNRYPEDTVMQAAETAIREVVGKNKMDFVLYEGRSEIAALAGRKMQEILDRYQTGISISKVNMQNAQPPEQVQAAFDDAVKAGQDRERQKNEGQAYANDVIPRARGNASRTIEEATGYARRVAASAEGDASRFKQILAEYEKAPQVTRERMYLDSMQQVLSNTSKVLIDQKAVGNNLLYLPLDKLMPPAAPAPEAPESAAARAAAPEAAPSPEPSGRSRDAFRNREREVR